MHRLLSLVLLLVCTTIHAQGFPTRPMRILVPYAAGGLLDVMARQIAAQLAEQYGQGVVVENRTGAASAVAVDALRQAGPDGHTLLLDNSGLIITPVLNPKATFSYSRDMSVVSIVTGSTSLLAVNNAVPARDVKELVALARARPGALNYSSAGVGTILHMSGEMFKAMAKVDIVHVPYKGGSAAMNDVVSGQIHMIFLGPSILAPFLKDGRVRAIASTGTRRIAAYPDVPTIAESGYPDYDIVSWIGLFVLKSTSPDTVMRLAQGVRAILSRPAFREVIAKNNLDVMGLTGDDAQHLLEQEERRWAEVIKANRIRVE